jgi:hypothetical protein
MRDQADHAAAGGIVDGPAAEPRMSKLPEHRGDALLEQTFGDRVLKRHRHDGPPVDPLRGHERLMRRDLAADSSS